MISYSCDIICLRYHTCKVALWSPCQCNASGLEGVQWKAREHGPTGESMAPLAWVASLKSRWMRKIESLASYRTWTSCNCRVRIRRRPTFFADYRFHRAILLVPSGYDGTEHWSETNFLDKSNEATLRNIPERQYVPQWSLGPSIRCIPDFRFGVLSQ